MIRVATIAIGFDIDADRATRNRVANSAFDLAEQAAREFLTVADFGVEAIVDRGSIDVFVTVVLTAQTLLATLAVYGSAAKGLDRLKADIKAMKKYFVKELPHRANLPEEAFETSRLTMEELSKIGKFIKDVERGQLPATEGAKRACAELELLDAPLDKKTKRQLEKSFSAIAPKPEEQHQISDAAHGPADASRVLPAHRRRVPRRPSRRDRIRIWRNPGESEKNREEP